MAIHRDREREYLDGLRASNPNGGIGLVAGVANGLGNPIRPAIQSDLPTDIAPQSESTGYSPEILAEIIRDDSMPIETRQQAQADLIQIQEASRPRVGLQTPVIQQNYPQNPAQQSGLGLTQASNQFAQNVLAGQ